MDIEKNKLALIGNMNYVHKGNILRVDQHLSIFFWNVSFCNTDKCITFILTQYINQLNITNKQKTTTKKILQSNFFFYISDLTISYSKEHQRSRNRYIQLLWQLKKILKL
ncbi:hypothetical protein PO909_018446 [Leuciscus waleckii]